MRGDGRIGQQFGTISFPGFKILNIPGVLQIIEINIFAFLIVPPIFPPIQPTDFFRSPYQKREDVSIYLWRRVEN